MGREDARVELTALSSSSARRHIQGLTNSPRGRRRAAGWSGTRAGAAPSPPGVPRRVQDTVQDTVLPPCRSASRAGRTEGEGERCRRSSRCRRCRRRCCTHADPRRRPLAAATLSSEWGRKRASRRESSNTASPPTCWRRRRLTRPENRPKGLPVLHTAHSIRCGVRGPRLAMSHCKCISTGRKRRAGNEVKLSAVSCAGRAAAGGGGGRAGVGRGRGGDGAALHLDLHLPRIRGIDVCASHWTRRRPSWGTPRAAAAAWRDRNESLKHLHREYTLGYLR